MDTDTKLTVIFLVAAFVAAPVIIWVELAVTRRRNRRMAAERAAQRERLAGAIGRLEQRGYVR